jgi:hypothetical protein
MLSSESCANEIIQSAGELSAQSQALAQSCCDPGLARVLA